MRYWAALVLLLASMAYGQPQAQPAGAPVRRALVIGNSEYANLPRLPIARTEAQLMAESLRKAGFEVTVALDIQMPAFFTEQQNPFIESVKPGDVSLVYYAGYAIQGEDDNYLLPINFANSSSEELQTRAYHLAKMQELLEGRTKGLKLFIIEGSQPQDLSLTGAVGPGFRAPDLSISTESLFAFSSGLGQLQAPSAPIGKFTQEVVNGINQPQALIELFANAKRNVGQASQLMQVPYVVDNILTARFYFHEPVIAKAVEPATNVQPMGVPAVSRRDRLEYVFIPAGKFEMGCVLKDTQCEADEKPRHTVQIAKGFWLGRTETEVNAYQRYLEADESKSSRLRMPPAPAWGWKVTNNPMVNVTWDEASRFCTWAGGRLPTEAEWEYASRAGVEGEVVPLNDENMRDKSNFYGKKGNDRFDVVAPVRSFDPNAFGLFDMSGNVWEWVSDWYSPTYYQQSPGADPQGPQEGKERVARGGSFDSDPRKHLRISIRQHFGKSGNSLGFRCVLEDTPDTQALLNLPPR